jgi:hypothetical protein
MTAVVSLCRVRSVVQLVPPSERRAAIRDLLELDRYMSEIGKIDCTARKLELEARDLVRRAIAEARK